MKEKLLLATLVFFSSLALSAQEMIVQEKQVPGFFPIVSVTSIAAIYVDENDHWLMHKAAEWLRQDLEMITGRQTTIISTLPSSADFLIIIGSLDSSSIIQRLAAEKKIQADGLAGQWEKFQLQTVSHPMKNVQNALVIAGSDKRGTAYAVLELSKQMGVSPWYWWADVPAKKKKEIYFKNGLYVYGVSFCKIPRDIYQ